MEVSTAHADQPDKPKRVKISKKVHKLKNAVLTLIVFGFVISCVIIVLVKGSLAVIIIGAVAAAVAVAGGLITITHGRLNLELVAALLTASSAIFLVSAVIGFRADHYGPTDAGVTPSQISDANPNSSYSLTVSRPARRHYLSLTVQLQQTDINSPACVDDIQPSVSINGLATGPVTLRSGIPTNIPVGTVISARQFLLQLTLEDDEPNATCQVEVSVKGTLHN